jgi:hypothetical protein
MHLLNYDFKKIKNDSVVAESFLILPQEGTPQYKVVKNCKIASKMP